MKITKYAVLHHQSNDSGNDLEQMGMSKLFDTRKEAEEWIEICIAEDTGRAIESRRENGEDFDESDPDSLLEVDRDAGSEVVSTRGNGETTFYHVEKIEWEDRAADCVREVEDILKDFKRDPKTGLDELQVIKHALNHIGEHEKEWLPLRAYAVDVRFCPACCVHNVLAHTEEEAKQIVDNMIDKRTLVLTDEQKAEMMDCLLENVEDTYVVGPKDD